MEIEKLSRCTPLMDTPEWESCFVKVVQAKEITFTTNTDVNLTMRIIFSIDGRTDGHEHKFKLSSGWTSRSIRRSLPYCKVILTNETEKENEILILSVISDKKIDGEKLQIEEKSVAEIINETDEADHEEKRSKSPFKSILSRRRKSTPKSLPIDNKCRVPEHVPKGGLLCGDWNGLLKTIPPPIVGISDIQILTFQNNNFEWVILSEDEKKDGTVSWRFD